MDVGKVIRVVASGAAAGVPATGWGPVSVAGPESVYQVNVSPGVDFAGTSPHIQPRVMTMSESYTKAELDAKLEVVQAKAETVRVGLDAKLDQVLNAIGDLRDKVHEDLDAVKDDNKSTRRVVIVTIIVSAIAAVGAIYAAQANNIAAMQVGLDAAAKAE